MRLASRATRAKALVAAATLLLSATLAAARPAPAPPDPAGPSVRLAIEPLQVPRRPVLLDAATLVDLDRDVDDATTTLPLGRALATGDGAVQAAIGDDMLTLVVHDARAAIPVYQVTWHAPLCCLQLGEDSRRLVVNAVVCAYPSSKHASGPWRVVDIPGRRVLATVPGEPAEHRGHRTHEAFSAPVLWADPLVRHRYRLIVPHSPKDTAPWAVAVVRHDAATGEELGRLVEPTVRGGAWRAERPPLRTPREPAPASKAALDDAGVRPPAARRGAVARWATASARARRRRSADHDRHRGMAL